MPVIENYKGFAIWYNEKAKIFLALVNNEITLFDTSLDGLKQQIDNRNSNPDGLEKQQQTRI